MADMVSNVMRLDAIGVFEIFCWGLQAIHFRAQADELARRDRSSLALKFSEFATVVVIILWKFWVKITRVVEIQTVHHVGIQIVSSDSQHKLSVSVNKSVQRSAYFALRWSQ